MERVLVATCEKLRALEESIDAQTVRLQDMRALSVDRASLATSPPTPRRGSPRSRGIRITDRGPVPTHGQKMSRRPSRAAPNDATDGTITSASSPRSRSTDPSRGARGAPATRRTLGHYGDARDERGSGHVFRPAGTSRWSFDASRSAVVGVPAHVRTLRAGASQRDADRTGHADGVVVARGSPSAAVDAAAIDLFTNVDANDARSWSDAGTRDAGGGERQAGAPAVGEQERRRKRGGARASHMASARADEVEEDGSPTLSAMAGWIVLGEEAVREPTGTARACGHGDMRAGRPGEHRGA